MKMNLSIKPKEHSRNQAKYAETKLLKAAMAVTIRCDIPTKNMSGLRHARSFLSVWSTSIWAL